MRGEEPGNGEPWLVFTVRDVEGIGVEIAKLTHLLNDLSSAFYAIARAQIGVAGPRPGRRAVAEEILAAFRLVRVTPGSTVIELAPPSTDGQTQLQLFEEPTAEDVAFAFYEEIECIERGTPPVEGRWDVRRHVRAVVEDAGEIGQRAEIVYRPRTARPGLPPGHVLTTSFRTTDIPQPGAVERSTRRRRFSGHAYMADVEPGRQRMRIKLPDGRDVTLEVDEQVAARIVPALDRVVEIEVDEDMEGDITARRVALGLEILPSSGAGSDVPPKSVEELEREQDLPEKRPDYVSLASAIWRTQEELVEFDDHLREMRRAQSG